MAEHDMIRLATVLLAPIFYIMTVTLNARAGEGLYPFMYKTANISAGLVTQVTPAGWTFSIWSFIYITLAAMLIFIVSGVFRKNASGYMYCSPAVLSHGFFASWFVNMGLNTGWLFLWDKRMLTASAVVLSLIAASNYAIVFFACWGLTSFGPWLNRDHKRDLWLYRVLVQNGMAMYTTWTTIAALLNVTVVLTYGTEMNANNASTVPLTILTLVVIGWFVAENTILDKHVRYILSVYPVVIWAAAGVFAKNYDAEAPTRNNGLVAWLLALACVACVARVGLFVWRQRKQPLYTDADVRDPVPQGDGKLEDGQATTQFN